ncbi:uncharacterized protein LOC117326601 [Pecten maximus]|uniref:uncharacterized protein LOC117326601 n=1 Tax=Pecten maximus TaxID=6579 RepID=UPI00145812CF|nr:uncharacterized protein LOC117326601 [Pecten maximus]
MKTSVIRKRQLHSGTWDKSVRCQGVPHGGDEQNALLNTCSLDQFLNGLHQICRSLPFRNLLQALAKELPSVYGNLWNAIKLCSDGLFSDAKLKLVPNVHDMRSREGPRVMPLIKNQLPYRITKTCTTCKRCSESAHIPDIILSEFSRSTGFQGALTPFFAPPDLQCSQPGCDGQTKIELKFENDYPPLIIAADLQDLHKRIPNSHLSKVVDLFGQRYMPFLLTIAKHPAKLENGSGIPGHYMSYVFMPADSGQFDEEGKPVGNWYRFLNNENGDLEPWSFDQDDPDETFPSFIYFIWIPPSKFRVDTSG